MNAVSPTRSTRTLLALSCWHSAEVSRANMMSKSKYEKSTELDSFKNGLHGIGSGARTKLRRLPQTGQTHWDRTPDLQKFCRCQKLTHQTGKAHTSQERDVVRHPVH